MKGYRTQKKYLFAVSNIKMDAQLEEFFLKQKEINYLAGSLIYYHYKVYKRVQKKKKEKAAKLKKKKADAAKKKKKGFKPYPKEDSPGHNLKSSLQSPTMPNISTFGL